MAFINLHVAIISITYGRCVLYVYLSDDQIRTWGLHTGILIICTYCTIHCLNLQLKHFFYW